MTSYRTVVFGAVMFVAASAPALADSATAVPQAPPPPKKASSVTHRAPAPVFTTSIIAPSLPGASANLIMLMLRVLNPLGANG